MVITLPRIPHASSARRIFTAFTTESIAISYWRKHMHMQLHEKSLENRASGLAVAEEATRFRLTPIGAC
jgi:hypothetical protein